MEKEKKFKPFDKILVRDAIDTPWSPDFFSYYTIYSDVKYATIKGGIYKYCIHYKGNEDLVGTTNAPSTNSKERWRAKIKEKYYFVDSKGKVGCNWECRSVTDDNFYDFGNYFQTIEEAADMIVKMKKLLKGEWA